MMFLEVKEFVLNLHVKSRNPKWSQKMEGGGPPTVEFFRAKAEVN